MHTRNLLVVAVASAALALAGCNNQPEEKSADAVAEPATTTNASLTSPFSINELMVTWIDNASHVLWDAEREGQAPANDRAWTEIEDHAVQVGAAAVLIQIPGTGKSDAGWVADPKWRASAQQMAQAAVQAREAAKSRNLEALKTANGQLVASCEACHQAFKPELPTEGILHQPQGPSAQ